MPYWKAKILADQGTQISSTYRQTNMQNFKLRKQQCSGLW